MILGNLLNRTVAMIEKYFDGKIPAYVGSTNEFEQSLLEMNQETVKKYEECYGKNGIFSCFIIDLATS